MLKCAILELHVLQKLDMFMGSDFGTIGFGCFPRCQKRSKGMRDASHRIHKTITEAFKCKAFFLIEYKTVKGSRVSWFHGSVLLANVNSRSRSMSSSVRLSVCNVRAPYSGDWNFRQCFYSIWFGTLAICWHPIKILRRSSQGNHSTTRSTALPVYYCLF